MAELGDNLFPQIGEGSYVEDQPGRGVNPLPQAGESYYGSEEDQPVPVPEFGVNRTNFNIGTLPQGISGGPYLNLTGNYNRSTVEKTPESMGIPQEAIDHFRLKNEEQKSSSYNVAVRAMFPDGMVPDFIDRVLRPKSVNVNYGQFNSTTETMTGDKFEASNISRGIGGQGQVLRGMFGENAPTVGLQFDQPNRYDKRFSGNMNIPVGDGSITLEAAREINKMRDNATSFKAGVNYPVGPGTLSASGERTAQGENKGNIRFKMPL
jgi:hypothetical protein|tara:strand:+ start:1768 stop:2562 length:795 start_codon:yes stop_codon:yes gene_type:complete